MMLFQAPLEGGGGFQTFEDVQARAFEIEHCPTATPRVQLRSWKTLAGREPAAG